MGAVFQSARGVSAQRSTDAEYQFADGTHRELSLDQIQRQRPEKAGDGGQYGSPWREHRLSRPVPSRPERLN
jgi:hypothetical protein